MTGALSFIKKHYVLLALGGLFIVALTLFTVVLLATYKAPTIENPDSGRLITVYDRGLKVSFLSKEKTLGAALKEHDITVYDHDAVEPLPSEELIAPEYRVNIYRARPIIIIDGSVRTKTVTAFQSPKLIANEAGFRLNNEDTAMMQRSDDILHDGVGLKLVIDRAVPIELDLYGRLLTMHTQADTVGDMLAEKGISIGKQDRVSLATTTPITPESKIRVWREGKQTLSIDEQVPFGTEIVYDADRPLGYRESQTKGTAGVRTITYEVEIKDGVEVYRNEIARIVTKEPAKQIDVIGLQNNGTGLTKSKGAQYFVDSRGVSHRETYYDLPMNVVMGACGQGGLYTVRPDGAKVDAQGYIIIAANYARYPRCSIVETSLGPGKVYDTGGFAAVHPEGFDLATDWTNYNGI